MMSLGSRERSYKQRVRQRQPTPQQPNRDRGRCLHPEPDLVVVQTQGLLFHVAANLPAGRMFRLCLFQAKPWDRMKKRRRVKNPQLKSPRSADKATRWVSHDQSSTLLLYSGVDSAEEPAFAIERCGTNFLAFARGRLHNSQNLSHSALCPPPPRAANSQRSSKARPPGPAPERAPSPTTRALGSGRDWSFGLCTGCVVDLIKKSRGHLEIAQEAQSHQRLPDKLDWPKELFGSEGACASVGSGAAEPGARGPCRRRGCHHSGQKSLEVSR